MFSRARQAISQPGNLRWPLGIVVALAVSGALAATLCERRLDRVVAAEREALNRQGWALSFNALEHHLLPLPHIRLIAPRLGSPVLQGGVHVFYAADRLDIGLGLESLTLSPGSMQALSVSGPVAEDRTRIAPPAAPDTAMSAPTAPVSTQTTGSGEARSAEAVTLVALRLQAEGMQVALPAGMTSGQGQLDVTATHLVLSLLVAPGLRRSQDYRGDHLITRASWSLPTGKPGAASVMVSLARLALPFTPPVLGSDIAHFESAATVQGDLATALGSVLRNDASAAPATLLLHQLRGNWGPLDASLAGRVAFSRQGANGDLDFTARGMGDVLQEMTASGLIPAGPPGDLAQRFRPAADRALVSLPVTVRSGRIGIGMLPLDTVMSAWYAR